jgi:hypothetical protein
MSAITDTSPPTAPQSANTETEDGEPHVQPETPTGPRTQWLPNPNTGDLEPFVDGKPVAWAPMPGSQVAFLSCPVFEVLLHGNRGPGKTCSALMDFAQHVGKGYGRAWQGLVFRRTYPELEDIVNQAKQWYPRIWPNSRFHETKHAWEWETGEVLSFRHADRDSDYWKMHGSNRPWILWEELTTWPNLNLYHMMMSICRAPVKEMPRKYRATTNPFGVGHNAVKKRFRLGLTDEQKKLPVKPKPPMVGPIIRETLKDGTSTERVAIRGDIAENKILLHSDPGYVARLTQAAPNPAALLAWLEGDWDVVAGGLLDDVWVPSVHVIPDIPGECIPKSWRIARAYDHGQSRPFAVQWWAQSDGTPATFTSPVLTENGVEYLMQTVGQVAGDEILLNEWYGARKDEKGQTMPNAGLNLDAGSEIAPGIRDREERYFARYGLHVHPGPADSAIFDDSSPGKSVAADMRRAPGRITWTRADKRPGSRIQGVQQIRRLLKGSLNIRQSDDPTAPPGKDIVVVGPRTTPGMFICQNNVEWLRTVPVLPRDPKQPDDADTNAEDHCLVGNTLVQTTLGPRRLSELVGTEGFVYGHDGRPHRYRNCRLTRRAAPIVRLEFEDGTSIECTPDHKIMLEDLSWKRADALRSSDRVCSVLQFRYSEEFATTSADATSSTAADVCTGKFTERTSARSPRTTMFTTMTVIGRTTSRRISTSWKRLSMLASTAWSARSRCRPHATKLRPCGMAAPRVGRGTAKTPRKSFDRFATFAARAATPFFRRKATPQSSAPMPASPQPGVQAASTTSTGHAPFAKRLFASGSISLHEPVAPSAVVPWGKADVYCMEVEDVHNFVVQGGVVVHNCFDTTRYYTRRASSVIRQEKF